MTATTFNLVIEQGATFSMTVDLLDANGDALNVGGYSACSQVRKSYESNTAWDFTTSLANGMLSLTMTANTTSSLEEGRYVYDAKLVEDDSDVATRVVCGLVTVAATVSR